jgi:hypothetical protein
MNAKRVDLAINFLTPATDTFRLAGIAIQLSFHAVHNAASQMKIYSQVI